LYFEQLAGRRAHRAELLDAVGRGVRRAGVLDQIPPIDRRVDVAVRLAAAGAAPRPAVIELLWRAAQRGAEVDVRLEIAAERAPVDQTGGLVDARHVDAAAEGRHHHHRSREHRTGVA